MKTVGIPFSDKAIGNFRQGIHRKDLQEALETQNQHCLPMFGSTLSSFSSALFGSIHINFSICLYSSCFYVFSDFATIFPQPGMALSFCKYCCQGKNGRHWTGCCGLNAVHFPCALPQTHFLLAFKNISNLYHFGGIIMLTATVYFTYS